MIDRVKKLDYEGKDLSNAVHTKEHEYEERMRDASGSAQVSKLKKAIAAIKLEVQEHTVNEGVMNSVLFTCAGMRRGKHHLFDELADPSAAAAAGAAKRVKGTATKNNTEEA